MKAVARMMFMLIIGILLSSGCATHRFTDCLPENSPQGLWAVHLTDNLPQNLPKGYAEFYSAYGDSLGFQIPIYQIEGPKESLVGNACTCDGYTRRRVACLPGTNTFLINPGSERKRVDVVVKEGMVTPVRMTFTELSRKTFINYKSYTTQVGFRLTVNVEDPQPLEQHETRLGRDNSEKMQQHPDSTVPPRPTSISLTAQYPISGVTFSVLQGDLNQMLEARELLNRAAKDLDLTIEPDKKEFMKRYKDERRKHSELQNLLILCSEIKGL